MYLSYLEISHVRNLHHIYLDFDSQFNIIYGENGSGKTSILEAIFMLGYGRSFRSRHIERVITHDIKSLSLFAKIEEVHQQVNVGIEKDRNGKSRYKIANHFIDSAADLAKLLPIKLINPDSYNLLEAGPIYRRQFLDWGLFHVEHQFYELWKNAQRILKQRNHLLRGKTHLQEIACWDNELAKVANTIHHLRQTYVSQFKTIFTNFVEELLKNVKVNFIYWPGWQQDSEFSEVLLRSRQRDIEYGYTQYGPHRADLKFIINNLSAESVLSRGQQKTLVHCLHLAQGALLKEKNDKKCIYLIDDLAAELDLNHRKRLIKLLFELKAQVFVTGIEYSDLKEACQDYQRATFNIQEGKITLKF